jgi:hypothetical protein
MAFNTGVGVLLKLVSGVTLVILICNCVTSGLSVPLGPTEITGRPHLTLYEHEQHQGIMINTANFSELPKVTFISEFQAKSIIKMLEEDATIFQKYLTNRLPL